MLFGKRPFAVRDRVRIGCPQPTRKHLVIFFHVLARRFIFQLKPNTNYIVFNNNIIIAKEKPLLSNVFFRTVSNIFVLHFPPNEMLYSTILLTILTFRKSRIVFYSITLTFNPKVN